ncbi:MAG: 1-phosphofructokinase, partial [Clostridiales bacterium]|nr:1-phosphofructokinase [Clostridiales bacterium]
MGPCVVTVTLNPALDKTVTIEKLVPGGLNRVLDSRIDAGGKGINVARVLNNFNLKTVATGLISGTTGEKLLRLMADEKLEADFLEIPGETRTNVKIFEKADGITTEINEAGFVAD